MIRVAVLATVLHESARAVVANRRLRRVAGTWGLWIAGEAGFLVFLSVTAYDRGGTTAVAVVGVVRMIPGALATPLLSVVADRFSRVRLLTAVLVSWTVLMAALPAALLVRSLLPMYLIVGAASVTGTLLRPAIGGLIPQVVDRPEELTIANSAYSVVEAAGTLLGPLLAGLLLTATGDTGRYLVLAAVFAAATAISLTIRTEFKPSRRSNLSARGRLLESLSGFAAVVRPARLRTVFAVMMAQCVTRGVLNVLVVAVAVSLIGSGVSSTGLLFAALGAGGLLGAVVTMTGTGWRPAVPFVLGMSLWGLPLLLIGGVPSEPVTWAALAVVGVGNALGDVYGLTLIHRILPDHVLGKAFGAFWGTAWASQALGALIAAPLIDQLGPRATAFVVGGAMAAVALLSWFSVRRVDTDLRVDEQVVRTLHECAVLAPLTRVSVEQLARHATRVDVETGAVVVNQGEMSDTFYVVESGSLEVLVDNLSVRRLQPGDCFGEIAALARSPRTATVRADTPCRLLALAGEDFVLAVTVHGPAEHTARAMLEDRMARATPAASVAGLAGR